MPRSCLTPYPISSDQPRNLQLWSLQFSRKTTMTQRTCFSEDALCTVQRCLHGSRTENAIYIVQCEAGLSQPLGNNNKVTSKDPHPGIPPKQATTFHQSPYGVSVLKLKYRHQDNNVSDRYPHTWTFKNIKFWCQKQLQIWSHFWLQLLKKGSIWP